MKRFITSLVISAILPLFANSFTEITVKLKMDTSSFIMGERIRAVVDVANASDDIVDVGKPNSPDRLILELFRASDKFQFEKRSYTPFVAPFSLLSGEGQRLETFFDDHFPFHDESRYLARAVLIHKGMRFESSYKSFDVVPGLKCGSAVQMFAQIPNLTREFELVHWERNRKQHIFLKAKDTGVKTRRWVTKDLGPFLRVNNPKISILTTGEIIVLHRTNQDLFIRSEFWSLPDVLEFHSHELMNDPYVANSERVKALYKEAGGVEPVKKAWWKFW